jgi:flavin-binding protein dodecin
MTVVKVMELVGDSTQSWDDAIRNAVKEASILVDDISGVELLNMTANVKDGDIVEYKANIQIAYTGDSKE